MSFVPVINCFTPNQVLGTDSISDTVILWKEVKNFNLITLQIRFSLNVAMISEKMIFNDFDQMTFAFQQDFGLYILLGAIVFGFILSFAVIPPLFYDHHTSYTFTQSVHQLQQKNQIVQNPQVGANDSANSWGTPVRKSQPSLKSQKKRFILSITK